MSESTPPPAPGATDATPTPTGELRNYASAWATKKGTPLSALYAAFTVAGWDPGALVTEAEFDAAVEQASDITINAVHNERGPGEGK